MFDHPDFDGHEKVLMVEDAGSGLRAIIAVHSTVLGAAAGGCRLWSYDNSAAAVSDALRLSRGISYGYPAAQNRRCLRSLRLQPDSTSG